MVSIAPVDMIPLCFKCTVNSFITVHNERCDERSAGQRQIYICLADTIKAALHSFSNGGDAFSHFQGCASSAQKYHDL